MAKSTFRVRMCHASKRLIVLFARVSTCLNERQRQHLLEIGGAV